MRMGLADTQLTAVRAGGSAELFDDFRQAGSVLESTRQRVGIGVVKDVWHMLRPEESRRSLQTCVTGGFKMRSFLSSMTTTALAAVLVIISAAGLAAQSSTGNLRGTVKD